MAGRWIVHRNDQQLGPYGAEEIRQGLRDGHFDPFDLISREGSHVRIELMEIDEIFLHSQIEYMPGAAETQIEQAAGGGGGAFIGGAAAEVNPQHRLKLAGPQPASPAGAGGMVPSSKRQDGAKRSKQESPKRFFLVETNGKITGPMAASEIQTAWARGGLDKTLLVQKNNSSARVPIAKFVHLYAMAKLNGPQSATQTPSPLLSQMIRAEADRKGRIRKLLVPILGVLVLGLAIGVAVAFFGSKGIHKPSQPRKSDSRENYQLPNSSKPKANPQTIENDVIRPRPPVRRNLPAPNTSVRPGGKASKLPPPRSASQFQPPLQKVDAPKTQWRPPPTNRSNASPGTSPGTSPGISRGTSPGVSNRPVYRPAPRVTAPQVRAPVRAPVPVARAAPPVQRPADPAPVAPGNSAGGSNGIGDIGGATFNKADLDACAMKCKIKFAAKGEQITVVFFKGAFEDQLKAKKGPVTLTGRINQDAGGKTMYLQGIK